MKILIDMSTAYAKLTRETDPEKMLLRQLITDVRDFMADQGLLPFFLLRVVIYRAS